MAVEIEVTFDIKNGTRTYHVKGLPGSGCTDLTEAIEQANQTVNQEHTEEYVEQQEMPQYIEDL